MRRQTMKEFPDASSAAMLDEMRAPDVRLVGERATAAAHVLRPQRSGAAGRGTRRSRRHRPPGGAVRAPRERRADGRGVRSRQGARARPRRRPRGRPTAPNAESPGVDSDLARALLTAAIWLVVVVALRMALNAAFARYERRLAERDPSVAARRRTTFRFLLRVIVALAALIGIWSVLSIFPTTQEVARAFLASSAVLAVVAGLALTTPLGNLGSGVLLAFTQPIRLGDRITVDDHTGVVDDMTLSYTALATDEGRRIFVPNSKMVSTTIVNRSVSDPRRMVTVELPVRLGAPLDEARRVTDRGASQSVPGGETLDVDVQVGKVTESTAWLTRRRARAVLGGRLADRERHPRARARGAGRGRAAPRRLEVELGPLARLQHPHHDVRREPRRPRRRTRRAAGRGTPGSRRSPRCSGKYVPQWIGIDDLRADAPRPPRPRGAGRDGRPCRASAPSPRSGMSAEIDRADLVHLVEEIGVAGEVHGLRAGDDVAERLRRRAERTAAPVVLRRDGPDGHAADLERVALWTSRTLRNSRWRSRPPSPAGTTTGSSFPSFSSDGRSRWS